MAKYKEDNEKGVILEVDLEYPQELRDLHNDYPLTPEKMKVMKEMLSPYCESIREKINNRSSTLIDSSPQEERKVCATL